MAVIWIDAHDPKWPNFFLPKGAKGSRRARQRPFVGLGVPPLPSPAAARYGLNRFNSKEISMRGALIALDTANR